MDQQCCPGGNCPETPRRPPPDFLAKSLVIPVIYTKFKLKFISNKLEFRIYGWNYQWFSQKIRRPPWRTPRRPPAEGLRTISAGTSLLVHTVITTVIEKLESIIFCLKLWKESRKSLFHICYVYLFYLQWNLAIKCHHFYFETTLLVLFTASS